MTDYSDLIKHKDLSENTTESGSSAPVETSIPVSVDTEVDTTAPEQKIIQLILDEEGIPTIQSNQNNIAEMLGAFELAKELILQKRIHNPNIKQLSQLVLDAL